MGRALGILFLVVFGLCGATFGAETLRVATYNVRNYLSMDRMLEDGFRMNYPKPESEKAVVRDTIRSVAPDILALQEIGSEEYLLELRDDLAREGLVYEGWAIALATDEVRRTAALWKGEVAVEAVSHADLGFRHFGEAVTVKRGLLELKLLDEQGQGRASVFVAHLKSRYTDDKRDPRSARRRAGEAEAARERILQLYPEPESSRYLVVGDLNDGPNSSPVQRFLTKGPRVLARLLPAEDLSGLSWTHDYRKGGEYSSIDHMLVSIGWMEMRDAKATIADRPDYYEGSDHRMVWVDVALPAGD